jgi:hypothetical protein
MYERVCSPISIRTDFSWYASARRFSLDRAIKWGIYYIIMLDILKHDLKCIFSFKFLPVSSLLPLLRGSTTTSEHSANISHDAFLYSNSCNKGRIQNAAVPAFWLGTRCHRLDVHTPKRYGLSVRRTQMHKYRKYVYRS